MLICAWASVSDGGKETAEFTLLLSRTWFIHVDFTEKKKVRDLPQKNLLYTYIQYKHVYTVSVYV